MFETYSIAKDIRELGGRKGVLNLVWRAAKIEVSAAERRTQPPGGG